jgi:hypothetical protein
VPRKSSWLGRLAGSVVEYVNLEVNQFDVIRVFLNTMIISENLVICDIPDRFKKDRVSVKLN